MIFVGAERWSAILLRVALGVSFLSAVADRFGAWGAPGHANVAWGNFAHFTDYTRTLLWFAPRAWIAPLAWSATIAEVTLGIALLIGLFPRATALLSALLLLSFALAMAFSLGVKPPLDYSVFSAAFGALLLAVRSSPGKGKGSSAGWRKTR